VCWGAAWGHTEPAIWRVVELVRVSEIAGLVLRNLAGDPLLTRTGRGTAPAFRITGLTQMIFRTGGGWAWAGRAQLIHAGIWLAIRAVREGIDLDGPGWWAG
jgi:hypothetical protein